jgi:hypothetical protein
MLRFFLFMVSVMAVGISAAGEVPPCSVGPMPIQIMTPGYGSKIRSVAEISDALPHFRAFVTAITERINSRLTKDEINFRLAKDELCISSAESMESMKSAESERSLLQFVYWKLDMHYDYTVPVLSPSTGGSPPSCRISSPWIDLVVDRGAVPQIFGIVRWNERQLLTDQAVLDGVKNVPPGMAMPLDPYELGHFVGEIRRNSAAKPVEERVPPDILWLLRSLVGTENVADLIDPAHRSMYGVTKNGAEGYTQLVLALIDRCFASSASGRVDIHYNGIIDVADPVLLEQYRIKTRSLR